MREREREKAMVQKQTKNVINYHSLYVEPCRSNTIAFQASGDEIRIFYDIEIFLIFFFFFFDAIEFQS